MPTKSTRPLGFVAALVLVSTVAASLALAAVVRSAVATERRQLLHERTTEAGLVISSLFAGTADDLSILVQTTRPQVGATEAFTAAARPLLGAASAIGVLDVTNGGASVLAGVGTTPRAGTVVTAGLADLTHRALGAGGLVSAVIASPHGRQLAFAEASSAGLVVYETLNFDLSHPYAPGRAGPFSDLTGALYASGSPDPAALVLTTTTKLPLSGATERQSVTVGVDHWLLVTRSDKPLVGSLAANAPWGVLAAGLVAALLATVLVETLARRRRYALALVDERTQALRLALEEQARLEQGQREARQLAEAANRSKSEFLSRMSHELRTPLNAVLGFGQLLELDDLDEPQQEAVAQIIKGGRHLLGLINDVLDISRMDTGNLTMSPEPVLVSELIAESVTLMAPLAAGRGLQVVSDPGEPSAGLHILADRQRVKQIILNLVSNAIKYNRPDGVVTLSSQRCDSGQLRINVADTGLGIRPEDLDRLFVPFERLGAERTDVEGTGVGLVLSRRLAEAMGGTVGVSSTFGSGSTFWVELPMADDPLEALDRLPEPSPQLTPTIDPNRRHKVLYIEDNLPNVHLVERILARRGDIEVIAAMQGRLGLALAIEHHPVLILLDLHLPDIGGDEIVRELRANPATAETPVIILSADATAGQVERLLGEGAQAYLTKPLDVSQLLAMVDNAIHAVAL